MGVLNTVIILVFLMNAFLVAAGFNVADDLVTAVFDQNNDQVTLDASVESTLPTAAEGNEVEGADSSVLGFLDAIRIVFDAILFVISLVSAPLNIANAVGLPFSFSVVIFGPITVMYYLGIISLIRGHDT